MKKRAAVFLTALLPAVLLLSACGGSAAPASGGGTPAPSAAGPSAAGIGDKAYELLVYLDQNLSDRDCAGGKDYEAAKAWIRGELENAGYAAGDIAVTDFTFQTDAGASVTAQNIAVTKKGTSGRQIIIGAHFDGDGAGDNGSGTALALAAACAFRGTETYYDLTFVFFSAEEYGLYGSEAYAAAMTPAQLDATQYMINMDSLAAGDYCYLYGGSADFDAKTVTGTEAYENALSTAESLGLDVRSNPWTFDDPEPGAADGVPTYPSPSTGDWSDHTAFAERGLEYVYFEAANWDIEPYDGSGETEAHGMFMNTDQDDLRTIETDFPGRTQAHLTLFAALLTALAEQSSLSW